MALEFADKIVLLVDGKSFKFSSQDNIFIDPSFFKKKLDSIVRGTTSKEIVQMAKDVGAKKVIVASCAPPIRLVTFVINFSMI